MDKHILIYLYNETILKTKRKELIHTTLTDNIPTLHISKSLGWGTEMKYKEYMLYDSFI